MYWWDCESKTKTLQSKYVGTHGTDGGLQGEMPIVAMDYNKDATMFAYSAGYDWSKGYNFQCAPNAPHTERKEWIFVHKNGDEVKSKQPLKHIGWEI